MKNLLITRRNDDEHYAILIQWKFRQRNRSFVTDGRFAFLSQTFLATPFGFQLNFPFSIKENFVVMRNLTFLYHFPRLLQFSCWFFRLVLGQNVQGMIPHRWRRVSRFSCWVVTRKFSVKPTRSWEKFSARVTELQPWMTWRICATWTVW